MPKIEKNPIPKIRYHGGRWRIYWYWQREQFIIETDFLNQDDEWLVKNELRHISSALAKPTPIFPSQFAECKGAKDYLAKRYPIEVPDKKPIPDSPTILADYFAQLQLECSLPWAKTCNSWLNSLQEFVGGNILVTDAKTANNFLTQHLERTSKATRNRVLNTCKRFFNEIMKFGYVDANPFAGFKKLKEPLSDIIIYCTTDERERVIKAAQRIGRPDWLGIPIAFYAGCRREEVFKLRWEDVNFDVRRLGIRETKTEKPRWTPISKELLELLQAQKKTRGHVVPRVAGEDWETQADKLVELIRGELCRPENPNCMGRAAECTNKKRFIRTEEGLLAVGKVVDKALSNPIKRMMLDFAPDGAEWIPAERIGWNAWRHTFATLRVQAGVSLDKITSWMGNTPEVCRRHYAQFVPRDHYDEDIDK